MAGLTLNDRVRISDTTSCNRQGPLEELYWKRRVDEMCWRQVKRVYQGQPKALAGTGGFKLTKHK